MFVNPRAELSPTWESRAQFSFIAGGEFSPLYSYPRAFAAGDSYRDGKIHPRDEETSADDQDRSAFFITDPTESVSTQVQ